MLFAPGVVPPPVVVVYPLFGLEKGEETQKESDFAGTARFT